MEKSSYKLIEMLGQNLYWYEYWSKKNKQEMALRKAFSSLRIMQFL